MSAVEVLAALSDPARLAMLGRIAQAGDAGCELSAATGPGVSPRDARKQVARLTAAGLVDTDGPRLVARMDRIRSAAAELEPDEDGAAADSPARVRALFRRGRIVEIPRAPELRLSLLRHLAGRFEHGRRYTEPEVNAVLHEVHDDHVALRRHLVDARLLERDDDGATYWRAEDAAPERA